VVSLNNTARSLSSSVRLFLCLSTRIPSHEVENDSRIKSMSSRRFYRVSSVTHLFFAIISITKVATLRAHYLDVVLSIASGISMFYHLSQWRVPLSRLNKRVLSIYVHRRSLVLLSCLCLAARSWSGHVNLCVLSLSTRIYQVSVFPRHRELHRHNDSETTGAGIG
jgi:hypothetical protein